MLFTFILHLLLTATLSSASIFSFQRHSHGSSQQPIERVVNLPPDPCVRSFLPTVYGRCPRGFRWECDMTGPFGESRRLYCGCFPYPRRTQDLKSSLESEISHKDFTARRLAAAQNVTAMEVLSEIEPGNNKTLVSVFGIQCEKGQQHIACTQEDCGFACGCHDNWNTTDIGTAEYGDIDINKYYEEERSEGGDTVAASREEVPELKRNERVSDNDMEITYSDFNFQIIQHLFCRVGYRWICCYENCAQVCRCEPLLFYCPIQDLK